MYQNNTKITGVLKIPKTGKMWNFHGIFKISMVLFLALAFTMGKVLADDRMYTVAEHGPLKLTDNGYEELIVGISDSVSQDHCNQIIHSLKVGKKFVSF